MRKLRLAYDDDDGMETCDGCGERVWRLDEDWLCEDCTESSEDTSCAAMRREHGTW